MKKSILMLLVAGLFAASPLLAIESYEAERATTKEFVKQCVLQSDTLEDKIAKLQKEFEAGKKTYSKEDLKKLELKLKEANYLLDSINSP